MLVSPMRRLTAVVLLPLAVLLLLPSFSLSSVHRTSVPSSWSLVSPAPLSSHVTLFLALPQRNLDQLELILSEVSDPTHPSYQQWMTKADIDVLIAPPASTVSAVTSWLVDAGVAASAIVHHGDALEVNATVAAVNAAFNTTMHTFAHVKGGTHVAAHPAITLPAAVEPHVEMILGVQTFPFPVRHHAHVLSHRTPSPPTVASTPSTSRFHPMQQYYQYSVFTPHDSAAYYGFPDVTAFARPAGYTANTSVAVAQFDENSNGLTTYESYSSADIASQGKFAGVASIQSTPTLYGSNAGAGNPQSEPSLDIQTVTAYNPQANAWFWEEPDTAWIYGLCVHLEAQAVPPQVVSISYSTTEEGADDGNPDGVTGGYGTYLSRTETELTKLGALGVTMIAASGDQGANGNGNDQCQYSSSSTPYQLYVEWPSSSPHVTAVGATQINSAVTNIGEAGVPWCGMSDTTIPAGYTYTSGFSTPFKLACITAGSEVAVAGNFRSGGGFSRYYSQPTYQASAVNAYLGLTSITFPPASYYNKLMRGVPDVAMYGAGVPIVVKGQVNDVGGTSASAPLFAVVVSLLNQVSLSAGGKTLGFLNPLLYYMAANVSGAFKDITVGDNKQTVTCLNTSPAPTTCSGCQGFSAAAGWDPVTGLGSPVYSAMAAYVRSLAAASAVAPPSAPSSSSSSSSAAAARSSSSSSSSSSPASPSSSLSSSPSSSAAATAATSAAATSARAATSSVASPVGSLVGTSAPSVSSSATSTPASTASPVIVSSAARSSSSAFSASTSTSTPHAAVSSSAASSAAPQSPTSSPFILPRLLRRLLHLCEHGCGGACAGRRQLVRRRRSVARRGDRHRGGRARRGSAGAADLPRAVLRRASPQGQHPAVAGVAVRRLRVLPSAHVRRPRVCAGRVRRRPSRPRRVAGAGGGRALLLPLRHAHPARAAHRVVVPHVHAGAERQQHQLSRVRHARGPVQAAQRIPRGGDAANAVTPPTLGPVLLYHTVTVTQLLH